MPPSTGQRPTPSGVLDNDSYLYWTENHDSIINNFTNFLNEIKNNNEFIINDTYKNNLSSRLTDLDNPTVTNADKMVIIKDIKKDSNWTSLTIAYTTFKKVNDANNYIKALSNQNDTINELNKYRGMLGQPNSRARNDTLEYRLLANNMNTKTTAIANIIALFEIINYFITNNNVTELNVIIDAINKTPWFRQIIKNYLIKCLSKLTLRRPCRR